MKYLGQPQSGSLGGTTASRNRFGQYLRSRAIPVNPSTNWQTAVRSDFAEVSGLWRTLTSAQRSAWEALAGNYPSVDALGQAIYLSGFQMFVKINAQRKVAGDSVTTSPPNPPTAPNNNQFTIQNLEIAGGSFEFKLSLPTVETGKKLIVYASPPKPVGVGFVTDVRFLHVKSAGAAGQVDVTNAYVARFGVPQVGQRVFVWCRAYQDGFLWPKYEVFQEVIETS